MNRVIGIVDDLRFPSARISPADCVIAIGNFDGIHLGHRALLTAVDQMAKIFSETLIRRMVAFSPHPRLFFGSEEFKLIYTEEEKCEIAEETSLVDDLIHISFTREIAGMAPEKFYLLLKERYHAKGIVVGENFHFGDRGSGNAMLLKELCEKDGLKCCIVPELKMEDETVSSTRIKTMLTNGRVEEANELLGRPYFVEGVVRRGKHLGTEMKTPTVNVYFDKDQLVPKRGVYVSRMVVEGEAFPAVSNVGCNPTFGEEVPHSETFVLDFHGDLYDKKIRVELLQFVRPERRFESQEALRERLKTDIAIAANYFHEQKEEA